MSMKLFYIFLIFSTICLITNACRDLPNGQTVTLDASCLSNDRMFRAGCNAGGQGQICRFCGFGEFEDIPCYDNIITR